MRLAAILSVLIVGAIVVVPAVSRSTTAVAAEEGNWEIFAVGRDGRGLRNFTRNPAEDSAPAVSPNGRRIAFLRRVSVQNVDIWVMNADGSNQRPLLQTPEPEFNPKWSHDGRRIAFLRERSFPLGTGWYFDLYVMNADGTAVNELAVNAADFDWSPRDSRIVYESDVNYDGTSISVDVVDAARGLSRRLLEWRSHGGWYESPSWSPDARRVTVVRRPERARYIDLVDVRTGRGGALVRGWSVFGWSPNGRLLLFGRQYSLNIVDARTKRVRRLAWTNRSAAWSRDGKRVVHHHKDRVDRLYVSTADGKRRVEIFRGFLFTTGYYPVDTRQFDWLGDSRTIVYSAATATP